MSEDTAMAPIDHMPPQNPEAEEAVLGSCLMDPDAYYLASFLAKGDFYRERNAAIFEAIRSVIARGEKADFLTVTDELKRTERYDEVGGFVYLSQLVGVVPTAVHIEHYARIVQRTSIARRGIKAAGRIAGLMYDDSTDIAERSARAMQILAEALILNADGSVHSPEDRAQILLDLIDGLSAERTEGMGLMTGFDVDRALCGLRGGRVYLVAARPGAGKSELVQAIGRRVASGGFQVFLASAEMDDAQLVTRDVSALAGMDWNEIEHALTADGIDQDSRDAVYSQLRRAVQDLASLGLYAYDAGGMTSHDIKARASRQKATTGLDLVIIDYVQRLADPRAHGESENDRLTGISNRIADMAKQLSVPVILVSQLNREVDGRRDKHPMLSDLRGSGSLEQDAHAVLLMYREDYYLAEAEAVAKGVKGIVEICVAKNRSAPPDTTNRIYRLHWDGRRHAYSNMADLDGRPELFRRNGRHA